MSVTVKASREGVLNRAHRVYITVNTDIVDKLIVSTHIVGYHTELIKVSDEIGIFLGSVTACKVILYVLIEYNAVYLNTEVFYSCDKAVTLDIRNVDCCYFGGIKHTHAVYVVLKVGSVNREELKKLITEYVEIYYLTVNDVSVGGGIVKHLVVITVLVESNIGVAHTHDISNIFYHLSLCLVDILLHIGNLGLDSTVGDSIGCCV